MADSPLSGLSSAGTYNDADLLYIVQSGTSYKTTWGALRAAVAAAVEYPEVANYAALPAAASHTGEIYVVLASQGSGWLFTLKDSGFYYSNGSTWTRLGALPADYWTDSVLYISDNTDPTKVCKFELSSITGGNTRTMTIPDASGTLMLLDGALGTPSSGTLTNCTGLPTAGLVDDAVTYAKMQNVSAASKLLGRGDSGSGDVQEITLGSGLSMSGTTLAATATGGGTKTYAMLSPWEAMAPASNPATRDTRNGIRVLDFDDTTEESCIFDGLVMPEAASLGSGLKVRIHWAATSATTGAVRWGVQIERGTHDLDADSFDTAAEAHSTTNGTSGIITTTEITITTIDSLAAGESYRLKLYRDVSDTTNDTMTGDAELVAVEVRSAA